MSSLDPSSPRLAPSDLLLAAQGAVLLVFSSWAFGGRMPWGPPAILAVACLALPALWLRRRERGALAWPAFVPLLLWGGLLIVAFLNPSHVRNPGHGWLPRPGWIPWLPTIVDRQAALVAMLPWLAALLQGGVLAAVRPDRRVGRLLWAAAALNGFALAGIGAAFHFAGARKLLGLFSGPEPEYFFATFFYKNHWAAYGALSAIAGMALALRAWKKTVLGDPRARGRFVLFGGTSLLTVITLPLPGSRAGALLAALILLGFLSGLVGSLWHSRSMTGRRRWLIALALAGIVLGALGYGIHLHGLRGRMDLERTRHQISAARQGATLDLRFLVSGDTWRMAAARPWFGWGPGSFQLVFPIFQGDYLRGPDGKQLGRFEFAHNDWLQMAAETGGCGLAILILPLLFAGRGAWREGGMGGRWGLGGCVVLAAYAWIDFPFNNPAVLMLWTTMLLTARSLGADPAEESRWKRRRPRG